MQQFVKIMHFWIIKLFAYYFIFFPNVSKIQVCEIDKNDNLNNVLTLNVSTFNTVKCLI